MICLGRFRTVFVIFACLLTSAVLAAEEKSRVASSIEVQRALSLRGHDVGAVDGVWGKRSDRALQAFQRAAGLPATGIVDRTTLRLLMPERFGLDAEMKVAADQRTEPLLDRTNGDLVTLLRLSLTGIGHCSIADVDTTKVVERVKGRFADRYNELRTIIEIAADREVTGRPFLDDAHRSRSCPEWATTAASFGLVFEKPAPPTTHVSPPAAMIAPSEVRPAPSPSNPSQSTPWGVLVFGCAIALAGVVWWLRRTTRAVVGSAATASAEANRRPVVATEVAQPAVSIGAPADPLAQRLDEYGRTLDEARRRREWYSGGRAEGEKIVVATITASTDEPMRRQEHRPTSGLATELEAHRRSVFEVLRNPSPKGSPATWIPEGTPVAIGSRSVTRGSIWLGGTLPRRGDRFTNENCLVDPALPIATRVDPSELYLPYWPSYSDLSPSARKVYVDWLASDRSDPATEIGFVFLYFYGLERRLMIDCPAPDRLQVRREVERLLGIYGTNHSFRRYATTLLRSEAIQAEGLSKDPDWDPDASGFEVPLEILVALGRRVRDGQPIEPDLLLAFTKTHPETSVRTPAKRALAELRALFADAVEKAFPKGVRVGGAARIRRLKASYRAASGSFEIDLVTAEHGLPDISGLAEPIGTARRLLEDCTTALDAYSRELGKSPGLVPTLAAVARLPPLLRRPRAEALPGNPVAVLLDLARTAQTITARDLAARLGIDTGGSIAKARLRDWAALLAGLGFGVTFDPIAVLRPVKADDPAVVFALERDDGTAAPPGDAFRMAQLSLALAMMIALADGNFDPSEQAGLLAMIAHTEGLELDEQRRLIAEMKVQIAAPHGLADLKARLKAAPVSAREQLGRSLVAIAGSDGIVEPREVALLEKLFRQLDLDGASLYAQLHGNVASMPVASPKATPDPQTPAATPSPATAPASPGGIDLARLSIIRRETAGTASVLSQIFAEDEPEEEEISAPSPEAESAGDDVDDGLDGRHRALLAEIVERTEWPRREFDRLVRDAGLMPGAVIEALNDWALDRFDDVLIEGDDPIVANTHLLPETRSSSPA